MTLDEYNALEEQYQRRNIGAANLVIGSSDRKPDEVAGDMALATDYAKTTGNPAPPLSMVTENRDLFQQKINEHRNTKILTGSPRLTEWMRNPVNAAVAGDDLSGMGWFEGFGRGVVATGQRAYERAGLMSSQFMLERGKKLTDDRKRTFGELVDDASERITDKDGKVVETITGPNAVVSATGRWLDARYADMLGVDTEQGAKHFAARVKEQQDAFAAIPKSVIAQDFEKNAMVPDASAGETVANFATAAMGNPVGAFSWALETAGESAPQLLAALGVTLATRNAKAGAVVMGAGTYVTERYTSPAEFFQEKKLDLSKPDDIQRLLSDPKLMGEAQERGVIRGSIIAAIDTLTFGIAGKQLATKPIVNMIEQMVIQAAGGSGGEYLARVAAGQKIDWNEIVAEGFAEFASAPIDVAVAGREYRADARKAEDAINRKQLFEELSGNAQASVVRGRLPDKFREFVGTATEGGPVENIFIPANQFTTYFQGIGVDPFALIEDMEGVTREDLDAALAAGGDLKIPTATYAAKIAGSEHDAFLMENMRFDPNEFTAAEAADFNTRAQDVLDQAWEVAEVAREQTESLRSFEQEIRETIVSRLRVAGRSTDVANAEAMLYPAFYENYGARNGMTPDEFMQRYVLPRIEGALPEGMQFRDVGELDRTLAAARSRTAARDKRVSLLEFISDRGGIADNGGELKSRDAETVKRGRGKKSFKLRRNSLTDGMASMFGGDTGKKFGVDAVAAAAIEAGYLSDDPIVGEYQTAMREGREVPDITRALWDAIDKELRGEGQYSATDGVDPRIAENEAALDGVEQYLDSLGVSLDDDDATIKSAVAADQAGRQYGQGDQDRGGRDVPVQRNGDAVLKPVVIEGGERDLTIAEATSAWKKYKGDTVTLASGEKAALNRANKGLHSWMHGGLGIRTDMVAHLPKILSEAVTYADVANEDKKGQRIVHAVASVTFNGQPMIVRLTLNDVGDGTLRHYAIEGFDVAAHPASNLSPEGVGPLGQGAATPLNVGDAVASFKTTRRLFQSGGPGPRGSIQFPAGGVGDGASIIRLYENANLSTFVHETGHFFLTVMQDLAARGETAAASDLDVAKAWWRSNAADVAADAMRVMPDVAVTADDVTAVLDLGTTGDVLKDGAIDVGLQEQWARAFEAYLMDGKAPTVELRSAFEKFRAWLISIYKKVQGLGVNVSPELAGVFDRMLASDEQIATAVFDAGGANPVFASAEEMGLSLEEYARFLTLRDQSEAEGKAKLLGEVMAPLKRERDKAYKAEKAIVAAEVESEVNAYRYYRAFEWMANKRWIGEGVPANLPDMRLSKEALVARYGEGVLKTLPRGKQSLFVAGGMDPDEAAGWFGFDSGDQMITAIEKAPKRKAAIEAETDRLMRERHGDPLTDGSLEAAALDAVHGDKRGQWIAAELKAVAEVAGVKVPLTAKEAKATARVMVSRMKVRDALADGRFLAAERKAGKEAAKFGAMLAREKIWMDNARRSIATKARAALRDEGSAEAVAPQVEGANRSTGNYNETVAKFLEAKQRQLMNHALYAESRSVGVEVEKAENYIARLNKAPLRERIAGAGRRDDAQVDYLAAIDEVLERYDFRRLSGAAEQRRGGLNAFIAAMTAAGRENELAIPDSVLEDAGRKPYKTIPVEELRGVIDSLKNMEHVALRWDKLIDEKQQRELDAVVTGIVDAFDANVKKRPPGRVGKQGIDWHKGVRKALDLILTTTTILREIDGFTDQGAAYQGIKAPVDAAMNRLTIRKEKAAVDFEGIYSVYSKSERRDMAVRKHMPELGYALSKWERIALALNMGNEGNRQRLTDPRVRGSMTEAQIAAVLATLDARDADFVQSVWDYIASFRDDIDTRERRTTGVEPGRVEAVPVTIGGKAVRGGYYPIKYDPNLTALTRDDEANDIATSIQAGRFGKAQTRNGHLKARAKSSGRAIELDISVFHRHINSLLYDLELSETVNNSWRVLQDMRIKNAFIEAGHQPDFDTLEIWLQDVAQGEVKQSDGFNRSARFIKTNFTAAKLGFNLSTVAMQVTGLAHSFVVVGKKDMALGIAKAASNPAEASRVAMEKSTFMKTRQETFNKDVNDFYTDSTVGAAAGRWAEFKKTKFGPAAFFLMTKVQWHSTDVPTWHAGYIQGLRKFGNDEAKAIAHADDVVKRAQASGMFSDRSAIERGSVNRNARQQDIVRLFTTLGSYMFAKFNIAYERTQVAKGVISKEGLSVRSAQEAFSYTIDMAFLFVLEQVVVAAVKGGLPGGDDDDDDGWLLWLAKNTGLAIMGTAPAVRDGASAAEGYAGGGVYGAAVEDTVRGVYSTGKVAFSPFTDTEITRSDVKAIINGAGLATGIPSTFLNRIVDAGSRQSDGEDVSPMEYLIGKSKK